MNLKCKQCQAPFSATSPRAAYCSDRCRKRASRARDAGASAAAALGVVPGAPGTVAAAVAAALAKASMIDSPAGRTALVLAGRLDNPDGESGAGLAAVARQLSATLAAIDAAIPVPADALASIRARRDMKRAGHPDAC